MISRERFKEKFQDKVELLGWKISEKRAKLIYDHVMNYDVEDFEEALDIITDQEMFNFQKLERTIRECRSRRLEAKSEMRKKVEERAFMIWWKSHQGTKTECVNCYRCYECKRIYCDVVASACCQAFKALIKKEKTQEQITHDLSRFQGM